MVSRGRQKGAQIAGASKMASGVAGRMADRIMSWEDVEEQLDPTLPQDPKRRQLALFLTSTYVEYFLAAIITFNIMLIIVETDSIASGGSEAIWVIIANEILFWLYCVELMLKLFVYRSKFRLDGMNMFDAFVVTCDLVQALVNSVAGPICTFSITRCIRLVRLTRTFKLLRQSNELTTLMVSCAAGLKAVSWGLVMVCVMVLIWAILSVQLLDDLNQEIWRDRIDCDRCYHAFGSVWAASLTIIQTVIAGDDWGTLAMPLIERSGWTLLFFAGMIVSLDLALLNLILAVMIECAQEAKQMDDHQKALLLEKAKAKAKSELYDVCQELDENNSGSLTIEEFMLAFENNARFADLLAIMNISQDDMHCIFQVLDSDGSGQVESKEFVERLYRMKTHETQQILFTVSEIKHMLIQERDVSPSRAPKLSTRSHPAPEKKSENIPGSENQDQVLPANECVHLQGPILEFWEEPTPIQEAEKIYQQLLQINSEVDASLQSLTHQTETFMQNLLQGAGTHARALSSLRIEFPHVSQHPIHDKEREAMIADNGGPSARATTLRGSTNTKTEL